MNIDLSSFRLKINDIEYNYSQMIARGENIHSIMFYDFENIEYLKQIALFIERFFDKNDTISLKTSGSTSKAKEIIVKKKAMILSASRTIRFLGLKKDDKSLLCLPSKYIGGQMMIVRALLANMSLYAVEPSLNPLIEASKYSDRFDFIALTPMQVAKIIENDFERDILAKSKNIIIGGAAIDKSIEDKLKNFDNKIYSTYAMTETLSHIAVRQLNGENRSEYYTALDNVEISESKRQTLVVFVREQMDRALETNDIVEFDSLGRFKVIGRTDNVINTGAIKVQIEELETKLFSILGFDIVITYNKSKLLGQEIVLLIEEKYKNENDEILKAIQQLEKYHRPKSIFYIKELPKTENGKIDRLLANKMAEEKSITKI